VYQLNGSLYLIFVVCVLKFGHTGSYFWVYLCSDTCSSRCLQFRTMYKPGWWWFGHSCKKFSKKSEKINSIAAAVLIDWCLCDAVTQLGLHWSLKKQRCDTTAMTEYVSTHTYIAHLTASLSGAWSRSSPESGFGPESDSESFFWRTLQLRALSVSSGPLCKFVAVHLTFVQFILQLEVCTRLYTFIRIKIFILQYTVIMLH